MTQSDVQDLGFPAIVKHPALPPDYYAELEAAFPRLEEVRAGESLEDNRAYRWPTRQSLEDPKLPPIWREFVRYHSSEEFFREFSTRLGSVVERTHPLLERNFGKRLEDFSVGVRHSGKDDEARNRAEDVMMDVQFSWNSPVRLPSSVRGPHLDSPFKLFAALLYFRDAADDSTGADLEFYRLRHGRYPRPKPARIEPDQVEATLRVPYAPNTLALFVNSPYAIHGVTPRSVTDRPRRYVNFLGECYRGRAPDFFIAPDARTPYRLRQLARLWHRYA